MRKAVEGPSSAAIIFTMQQTSVKEEARQIVERLPEDATWEDLAHLVAMHERLARARRDSAAGLGISVDEARKQFGITS